jgi:CRP-like cAMP-binding protein
MPRRPLDIRTLLSALPLFSALGPEELDRLASHSSVLDAPRGRLLFEAGESCTGFHAVLYGRVKLAIRGADGTEKVIDLVGPRQTFGEAVMFLGEPYRVSAQALEDTKLVFVPREAVLAEIDADPKFARRLLASLSARLHRLVSDIESYTLRSGTARVACYLLGSIDCDEGGLGSGTLPVSKRIIASRLNLTQEHFSRILHELAAAHLIAVDGRNVEIRNAQGLRALM